MELMVRVLWVTTSAALVVSIRNFWDVRTPEARRMSCNSHPSVFAISTLPSFASCNYYT